MWKIKSTLDYEFEDEYETRDVGELEMRALAEQMMTEDEHVVHLPHCTVIYDDEDEWEMMWLSSPE